MSVKCIDWNLEKMLNNSFVIFGSIEDQGCHINYSQYKLHLAKHIVTRVNTTYLSYVKLYIDTWLNYSSSSSNKFWNCYGKYHIPLICIPPAAYRPLRLNLTDVNKIKLTMWPADQQINNWPGSMLVALLTWCPNCKFKYFETFSLLSVYQFALPHHPFSTGTSAWFQTILFATKQSMVVYIDPIPFDLNRVSAVTVSS